MFTIISFYGALQQPV